MNTISARIVKNEEALQAYGVSIKDASGELRSTYDILVDLYPKWQQMSNAEKTALGATLAGTNQYKVFSAVLNEMDVAINATTDSILSLGATEKQNAIYMESMEAKANQLKQEFNKLVLGDGGLETMTKGLISLGGGILSIINKLGGLKTILTALVGVIVTINIQNTLNKLSVLYNTLGGFSGAIKTLSANVKTLAMSFSTAELAVGGFFAILTIAISAYSAYQNAQEEAKQSALETINTFEQYQQSILDTIKKINDESVTKEQLISINKKLDKSYDTETAKIKDINDLRKESIDLLLQEEKAKAQEIITQTGGQYAKATSAKGQLVGTDLGVISGFGLGKYGKAFSELYSQAVNMYGEEASPALLTRQEAIEHLTELQTSLNQKQLEGIKLTSEEASKLQSYTDAITVLQTKEDERLAIIEGYENAQKKLNMTTDEYIKYLNEQSAKANSLLEQQEVYEDALKDLDAKLEGLLATSEMTFEGITKAWNIANKAYEELNETGKMSAETYTQMLSLSGDYIMALFDEEGNLRATEDAEIALYKAKVQQMAITQAEALVERAVAYEKANGIDSYYEQARAIDTVTNSLWGYVKSLEGVSTLSVQSQYALRNQIVTLQEWADQAIANINVQDYYTDSTKSNTSATKAQTNALKEQVDTLKELVDNYNKVISYINSKIDDRIDKLEEERDKEKDAIQEQIDKLKEQQEAEEEFYQEKIDALKETNEQLQDQIEYEKLLDNLAQAKSKKVRIYREGVGFVYEAKQSDVSEARKNLSEYERKKALQDQIDELEKAKEARKKIYEQEVANLEKQSKAIEEEYEKQIKFWEDYKKAFKKMVDAYETEQNRKLALELTGIDFEEENWAEMLAINYNATDGITGNMKTFLDTYTSLLSQLETAQKEYADSTANTADSVVGSIDRMKNATASGKVATTFDVVDALTGEVVATGFNNVQNARASYPDPELYDIEWHSKMIGAWAKGSSYIPDDQMAVVGENPYKEIVIGSKLNNGTLMNLSQGSGVVNARSTNTLAGLLNSIGSFASSNFGAGNGTFTDSVTNKSMSISIGNIELPSVTDGNSFVDYLQNFSLDMLQKAF